MPCPCPAPVRRRPPARPSGLAVAAARPRRRVAALYLVGRGIAELFVIHWHDPSSYALDWGGPSLAGVLAVHSGPGPGDHRRAGRWRLAARPRQPADAVDLSLHRSACALRDRRSADAGSRRPELPWIAMTDRKPPQMKFNTWIDQQVAEAERRGLFDDLPGKGKPLT